MRHTFETITARDQDDDLPLVVFMSDTGQQLGVQFNTETGDIEVGGWDQAGEWVDLVVRQACQIKRCYDPSHTVAFPLDQYKSSATENTLGEKLASGHKMP